MLIWGDDEDHYTDEPIPDDPNVKRFTRKAHVVRIIDYTKDPNGVVIWEKDKGRINEWQGNKSTTLNN